MSSFSANSIKLGSATLTESGGQLQINGSNLVANSSWSLKTANYNATSGEKILADTSGGTWSLTLPSSPSEGDEVLINDPSSSWHDNALTLSRNGSKINSFYADYLANVAGGQLTAVYVNSTIGWRVSDSMASSHTLDVVTNSAQRYALSTTRELGALVGQKDDHNLYSLIYPGSSGTDASRWTVVGDFYFSPVNTVAPSISGTNAVGQTLTSSSGTWLGWPAPSYSYQWQAFRTGAWVNISGATSATYVVTASESVRVSVTATNSRGSANVISSSRDVDGIPPIISSVSIRLTNPSAGGAGTLANPGAIGYQHGVTITLSQGTPTPTYTYLWESYDSVNSQWLESGGVATFMVNDDSLIRCSVTATNSSGSHTYTTGALTTGLRGSVNGASYTILGSPVSAAFVGDQVFAIFSSSEGTISYYWNNSAGPYEFIMVTEAMDILNCEITATTSFGYQTVSAGYLPVEGTPYCTVSPVLTYDGNISICTEGTWRYSSVGGFSTSSAVLERYDAGIGGWVMDENMTLEFSNRNYYTLFTLSPMLAYRVRVQRPGATGTGEAYSNEITI